MTPIPQRGLVLWSSGPQCKHKGLHSVWVTRSYYKIIVMMLLIINLTNQGVRVQYFTKSLLDVFCCSTKKDRTGWFKQNLTVQLLFFHLASRLIKDIRTCWWLKKMKRGQGSKILTGLQDLNIVFLEPIWKLMSVPDVVIHHLQKR